MEIFCIEVGYVYGVKLGNIVGVIVNEVGLESCFIGCIDIYDDFLVLDLFVEMLSDLFIYLKKVWVFG